MQGGNLNSLRTDNLRLILRLLCENGEMSRKELAAASGLTPAAVSKLTAQLYGAGRLYETVSADPPEKAGRRERRLSLRLNAFLALGVYAELDSVVFSIVDLTGAVSARCDIPFSDDPQKLVHSAEAFLLEHGDVKQRIRYIGICVTGSVTDPVYGQWDVDAVCRAFEEGLGLPAAVENNVKAFVLAQRYYSGEALTDRTLFFKWGPGIGSSFYAGGTVLFGDAGDAAEIGHYIVDRSGRRCRCGRYGCLETVCGVETILRETGQPDLRTLLASGESTVRNVLDLKIDTVAVALANAAAILDAQSVVFFGSVFRSGEIAEKLKKQLRRYDQRLKASDVGLSLLNGSIATVCPAAVCARSFFFSAKEETL